MNIKEGHFYFIDDSFCQRFEAERVMRNKEQINSKAHNRPCFYAIFDKKSELYWLVPLSKQFDKYTKIYNDKVQKYGKCDTIVFGSLLGQKSVFLIQNAFPITDKYIIEEYVDNKKQPLRVSNITESEVTSKLKTVLSLQRRGKHLLLTDSLTIEKELLKERKENSLTESNLSVREKISKLNENKDVSEGKNEADKEIDI